MRRGVSLLTILVVAGIWAVAAATKAMESREAESWFATFPGWLQQVVVLSEAGTAGILLAGFRRAGLIVGLILLLGFTGALIVAPPAPGQRCGCLGAMPIDTGPRDVAAHLFAFAALHLFAGVLVVASRSTRIPARRLSAG